MSNPFGDDLANEPFEVVFANLNPSIQSALDGFRQLAGMFGAGPQATADAVKTNLERAQGENEVAVASLLAGVAGIFDSYGTCFISVGDSLNAQIRVISDAWDRYGHTGSWTQPARRPVSGTDAPDVVTSTCEPRALTDDEHISATATESTIDKVRTIATNLASTSHHMFGGLVANGLPVGELMDAIDIAAVDHAKAFADLHKSLAKNVQEFSSAVENGVDTYQHTDRWSGPTVSIST
ncbi:hypothetical protein MSTE_00748 [Mycobacteroides stephanolepidis]|uniref:ESX-1 secretion-associated protein EspA/EspE-like domain-containing protein n=1 Tax=[Mycobacterium] stephanolepidis TaxID=1520670 RepID=A0A1Z4ET17_9MYCO|nr:hypothetical protein [[Mycobacterium] stephanolepidis]BAX96083.1 hypothetical protein MSTE_00748 [[Mycobacterium] stephanolepidis]